MTLCIHISMVLVEPLISEYKIGKLQLHAFFYGFTKKQLFSWELRILFMLCLANMPYGYYQLVRFLALVGFGVLAYQSHLQKKEKEVVIYIILAVLFQPILKIALGRTLWNIIDVLVAIGLIMSLFNHKIDKR